MEERNHVFMARKIFDLLRHNAMELCERSFVLGNIAPDITYSYVLRRHQFNSSSQLLSKKIKSLYGCALSPQSRMFSFKLGVIMHYVCDYFCYAHSSVFKGTLRDHIRYEKHQTPPESSALQPESFRELCLPESANIGCDTLLDSLKRLVVAWEHRLSSGMTTPQMDMQIAIYVGVWVASALFLSVEKAAPQFTANVNGGFEMLTRIPVYIMDL